MWGPWFMLTVGALGLLLLLVAIAFGTSALLFPVMIVLAIGIVAALVFAFRRSADQASEAPGPGTRSPRSGGEPASGEGSGSPTSPPRR